MLLDWRNWTRIRLHRPIAVLVKWFPDRRGLIAALLLAASVRVPWSQHLWLNGSSVALYRTSRPSTEPLNVHPTK